MCAESAVLIDGRFTITKFILISELGDRYPHSLVCEFQEGCYIFSLDKHCPLLPGPAIVTVSKYTLCITIFSNPQTMEGTTQYVFQESSVLPANVLLTAINSASVNAHLHCYIINLITVIVVCLLLRNSVSG